MVSLVSCNYLFWINGFLPVRLHHLKYVWSNHSISRLKVVFLLPVMPIAIQVLFKLRCFLWYTSCSSVFLQYFTTFFQTPKLKSPWHPNTITTSSSQLVGTLKRLHVTSNPLMTLKLGDLTIQSVPQAFSITHYRITQQDQQSGSSPSQLIVALWQ